MPCDPFSVPVQSYLPHTHSLCLFSLAHVHTCTHKRVLSGCCVSEVLFLYCSHISFWPTFFKLPMGFCMGRGTITFIYEIEGKETEVRDLFMFLFIFFSSFSLCVWCMLFFPQCVLFPLPHFYYTLLCVLKNTSFSLSLFFACISQPWHAR